MKFPVLYLMLSLFYVEVSYCQIISQFLWDSPPASAADIGPDASSISPSAISDVGGVGGTNGLNPGLPKRDLEMMIPGSPTFDVDGIDVSFDFQRDESVGHFFERSPSLIITGASNLSVSYRVDDGVGGFTTVNSGNVYAVPNDNIFRNYRFYYLPATGEGVLMVDGVEVWSNDGPDGRTLYWTGAGDVEVGREMDGSGSDRTIFDNLIVASVFGSPLPVELISFNAVLTEGLSPFVTCKWITLSENENDFFSIERSQDGKLWTEIGQIEGAGNSNERLEYKFFDHSPLYGVSYYRLKQVDFNGTVSIKEIRSVENDFHENFKVYPNPTNGKFLIAFGDNKPALGVIIYNAKGQVVYEMSNVDIQEKTVDIDLTHLPKGVYTIHLDNRIQQLVID